jgi:hypothetical protein
MFQRKRAVLPSHLISTPRHFTVKRAMLRVPCKPLCAQAFRICNRLLPHTVRGGQPNSQSSSAHSGLPMAQPNVTFQQHLPDRDRYQDRNVYLARTYDGEIERRTGLDATRP